MRARLKGLHSPDAPDGLMAYRPSDPERFSLLIQALVGPADSEGEESFNFVVQSPATLSDEVDDDRYLFARHRLLLQRWDAAKVESALTDLVNRTEGKDWSEIAAKLSRYGHWEFEDYRPA